MKLRTISNTLNIRNSVEYLTNAIMSGEDSVILDTEFGDIPVRISPVTHHNVQDPNFGIEIFRFREAPFTLLVTNLIRSGDSEKYRWYADIPCVDCQSKEFTRALAIRAMVMVMLAEIVEDTSYRFEDIEPQTIDTACIIYELNFMRRVGYGYSQFNRELCRLSVNPIQRMGQAYRAFVDANNEFLRIRNKVAHSREVNSMSDFSGRFLDSHDMTFGDSFYRSIFALLVEDLHISFHNNLVDIYNYVTDPKNNPEEECLPVPLMKICLLDKPLGKKKGDK